MKTLPVALVVCALCLLSAGRAHAAIVSKTVDYDQGGTALEGMVFYDDGSAAKRPGILVVHQWMGPGDHEKNVAHRLAALGYVAFVADVYGKDVRPKNPDEAGAQAGKYKKDPALLRARVAAGLAALETQPLVDAGRVAAIGYCFGGGAVLELARSGATLKGVVSLHGTLDTANPADAKNIKEPLLILHGADDPFVKPEIVTAFKKEMDDAGVNYKFIAYPGAVHAFTQRSAGSDPSKGAAYNAKADAESWKEMIAFLKTVLEMPE